MTIGNGRVPWDVSMHMMDIGTENVSTKYVGTYMARPYILLQLP